MTQLKPCPKCKSIFVGLESEVIDIFRASYYVRCHECNYTGKRSTSFIEAERVWNKMADDTKSQITIILDKEAVQINIQGKVKIKDGAIALGQTLGILLRGYDEDVISQAVEVFAHALEEKYLQRNL